MNETKKNTYVYLMSFSIMAAESSVRKNAIILFFHMSLVFPACDHIWNYTHKHNVHTHKIYVYLIVR